MSEVDKALAAHRGAKGTLGSVSKEQITAKVDELLNRPEFVSVIEDLDPLLPHLPSGLLQQQLANLVVSANAAKLQIKAAAAAPKA